MKDMMSKRQYSVRASEGDLPHWARGCRSSRGVPRCVWRPRERERPNERPSAVKTRVKMARAIRRVCEGFPAMIPYQQIALAMEM